MLSRANNCFYLTQARREPQRGPGKHYHGALTPYSVCLEIETPKEEETWREVSPHHPSRGSGERRKLPQRGPGRPKMDFKHILGQKEATWNTIFSCLSDGWAPKRRGARENFPPFPPSRRTWISIRSDF